MRTKIVVLCAGLVLALLPNPVTAKSKPDCSSDAYNGSIAYTLESFAFDMSIDMRCFGKGATLVYEGELTRKDLLGTQSDGEPTTCKKKQCSIHFEIAHGPIEHADYELWLNVQVITRVGTFSGDAVGKWTCTSAAVEVVCQ